MNTSNVTTNTRDTGIYQQTTEALHFVNRADKKLMRKLYRKGRTKKKDTPEEKREFRAFVGRMACVYDLPANLQDIEKALHDIVEGQGARRVSEDEVSAILKELPHGTKPQRRANVSGENGAPPKSRISLRWAGGACWMMPVVPTDRLTLDRAIEALYELGELSAALDHHSTLVNDCKKQLSDIVIEGPAAAGQGVADRVKEVAAKLDALQAANNGAALWGIRLGRRLEMLHVTPFEAEIARGRRNRATRQRSAANINATKQAEAMQTEGKVRREFERLIAADATRKRTAIHEDLATKFNLSTRSIQKYLRPAK